MFPIPTSFPANNSHRVALFLPDQPRDDFNRLEELTADGLHAARCAYLELEDWAPQFESTPAEHVRCFGEILQKRCLLSDAFFDVACALTDHLSREVLQGTAPEEFGQIYRDLQEALKLANRVLDLLAAERDIRRHRETRD